MQQLRAQASFRLDSPERVNGRPRLRPEVIERSPTRGVADTPMPYPPSANGAGGHSTPTPHPGQPAERQCRRLRCSPNTYAAWQYGSSANDPSAGDFVRTSVGRRRPQGRSAPLSAAPSPAGHQIDRRAVAPHEAPGRCTASWGHGPRRPELPLLAGRPTAGADPPVPTALHRRAPTPTSGPAGQSQLSVLPVPCPDGFPIARRLYRQRGPITSPSSNTADG
jgi:hypothetical protein